MTIQETAALLQTMDRVLLLTHVRPDGTPSALPPPCAGPCGTWARPLTCCRIRASRRPMRATPHPTGPRRVSHLISWWRWTLRP